MTRQKETKAHEDDLTVSEEVYKLARSRADQELTTMRDNLSVSHSLGLLSGRAQAFGSIRLISEFLEYKQLAQIIENEDYLKIPGVTSAEDYFEKLGLSRSAAYRNLKLARTLTVEEVSMLGQVGFTRRDLLSYASLPEENRLEIREGKVINIESASREEIKDVIEEIIAISREKLEESEAQLSAKDKVLKGKQDLLNKQERELKKYEKDAVKKGLTPLEDAYLQRMEAHRITFDGYMLQLEPDYQADLDLAEGGTARMQAAYVTTLEYLRQQLNIAHQRALDMYGDDTDGWQPPVKG